MQIFKYLSVLFAFLLCFSVSCKQRKKADIDLEISYQKLMELKREMFSLPSPFELNASLNINDIDTTKLASIISPDNFFTTTQLAQNAGIYMADLSFLSQTAYSQLIVDYSEQVYKLLRNLGLSINQIDSITMLIDQNINNYDSLQHYISFLLYQADAYLKNTGQLKVACNMSYGAWIETNYILLNALSTSDTNIIYRIIADEFFVLKLAIEYSDTTILDKIYIDQMKKLRDKISDLHAMRKVKIIDTLWDTTYYKTEILYKIDKEKLSLINQEFSQIREKLLKQNQ